MTAHSPERGEIWLVAFDPSRGDEIQKTRPAIVVSSSILSRLRLRIVVPVTNWRSGFELLPWHYKLLPSKKNGLRKASSADALQIKSVSLERFNTKLGYLSATELDEIACAITMVIEG